jgi:arsenate reductase (thioredoxin)
MAKRVLFLCTGNSCRSVMAEALLNHLGKGEFVGFSAGSKPAGYVHPASLETLLRHDVPTGTHTSKSWNVFEGQPFDVVVTVCDQAAGETCPNYPGYPHKLHWSIPDPAQASGTEAQIHAAFDDVFELIKHNIQAHILS